MRITQTSIGLAAIGAMLSLESCTTPGSELDALRADNANAQARIGVLESRVSEQSSEIDALTAALRTQTRAALTPQRIQSEFLNPTVVLVETPNLVTVTIISSREVEGRAETYILTCDHLIAPEVFYVLAGDSPKAEVKPEFIGRPFEVHTFVDGVEEVRTAKLVCASKQHQLALYKIDSILHAVAKDDGKIGGTLVPDKHVFTDVARVAPLHELQLGMEVACVGASNAKGPLFGTGRITAKPGMHREWGDGGESVVPGNIIPWCPPDALMCDVPTWYGGSGGSIREVRTGDVVGISVATNVGQVPFDLDVPGADGKATKSHGSFGTPIANQHVFVPLAAIHAFLHETGHESLLPK